MTAQLAQQADAGRVATRYATWQRQVENQTIRANVNYDRVARRHRVPAPIRAHVMATALERAVAETSRRAS